MDTSFPFDVEKINLACLGKSGLVRKFKQKGKMLFFFRIRGKVSRDEIKERQSGLGTVVFLNYILLSMYQCEY